jgi:hypothetical protein
MAKKKNAPDPGQRDLFESLDPELAVVASSPISKGQPSPVLPHSVSADVKVVSNQPTPSETSASSVGADVEVVSNQQTPNVTSAFQASKTLPTENMPTRDEYNRARESYLTFAKYAMLAVCAIFALKFGLGIQELPSGIKVVGYATPYLLTGAAGLVLVCSMCITAYYGLQVWHLDRLGRFSLEPELPFGRLSFVVSRRIFAFILASLCILCLAIVREDVFKTLLFMWNQQYHPIGSWKNASIYWSI